MPAGADPRKHRLKPSRAWRPGWVFAVGLSLLVHVGLLKVFLWVDGGAHGRVAASSAQQPRVIHAQLLSAPAPAAQKEVAEPLPPKLKATAPSLLPEQTQQQGQHQGPNKSGAPLFGTQAYLEPSEVDLTAQPLGDLLLEVEHWPLGVDELRVVVWVSETGAIVGWQVQGFDPGERHIQQMFAAFDQTPMTPAFKEGHAVTSVLYLALTRP